MIAANPSSTDRYRYATAMSLPLSLVRKLCACGIRITARQKIQYGRCDACVRVVKEDAK